jgi:hypothetical protein
MEPRRVLIAFDYRADGIWLVSTKEETEAPYEEWSRLTRSQDGPASHRPWGDLLSDQLLDDLKAWNDSWDFTIVQENQEDVPDVVLEARGRELAIRVQNELGTGGWEVLYNTDGRVHRVYPPGSWPEETWEQDLLGFAPRNARILEGLPEYQQQPRADGAPPSEP